MNIERNETGYHATSVENAKSILTSNFEKSISTTNKKHWLGNGVYFFTDIAWAVQWNINALKKKENKDKSKEDFTILESKINIDSDFLLDLSSVMGKAILDFLKESLIKKLVIEGRDDLIKTINNRSLKFFMNLLDEYGFLNKYYIVKATYIDKKEAKKVHHKDDFILRIQSQVCVRNIECIGETKECEDTANIKSIYSLLES